MSGVASGGLWSPVLSLARTRRAALARIVGWSLLESAPTLVLGLLVAAASDRFLTGQVWEGLGLLGVLLVTSLVGSAAHRQVYPWLAEVVEPVRDALVGAVVRDALRRAASADRAPDTAAVARLTTQVHAVRNILFTLLQTLRQTTFGMVAAVAGLFLLSPMAAWIAAGLLAVSLGLFAALLPVLASRHRAAVLAEERVAARSGDALEAVRDVVALGAEDRAVAEVSAVIEEEAAAVRAVGRGSAARVAVVVVGGQLPLVGLLLAAPWLIRSGHLTAPELIGAASYLGVSLEPGLRGVVGVVGSLGLELVVTLRRLLDTGLADPAPEGGSAERALAPFGHELVLDAVTFRYGPEASPVVEDLTLTVPEGDHLAIMGPSGVGKTTLVHLLGGVLAPASGSVRIGGVEASRLGPRPGLVAVVPQEPYVFAGTLRENLGYLAPEATDPQLEAAAAAVGLLPLCDRLGGLAARVGVGGAVLSLGERQLVALARVYASSAALVILDEGTCHLDPVAEARAERAFARRPGTLVVIAHRVSSGVRARRILLLDGDRAAVGTHAELLTRSGLYADLVGHWHLPGGVPASGSRHRRAGPGAPSALAPVAGHA